MSEDDRDLTQELEQTWANWTGGDDWTPEKTVHQFRVRGPGQRAGILDTFDKKLSQVDTSSHSENNLRKISELMDLRARLDLEHRTMLRNRR
jgi:hypothetical protein